MLNWIMQIHVYTDDIFARRQLIYLPGASNVFDDDCPVAVIRMGS